LEERLGKPDVPSHHDGQVAVILVAYGAGHIRLLGVHQLAGGRYFDPFGHGADFESNIHAVVLAPEQLDLRADPGFEPGMLDRNRIHSQGQQRGGVKTGFVRGEGRLDTRVVVADPNGRVRDTGAYGVRNETGDGGAIGALRG
jgi:hypothetical protein